MANLKINDQAPAFELKDQNGKVIKLSDFAGKSHIVLFFYPADYSPGCTAEACAFRDNYDVFKENGAEVIGISMQNEDSHKGFITKHGLQFQLLVDENGKTAEAYGIGKLLGLLPGRVTFVIDKAGIIKNIFSSQIDMNKHVTEAIKIIKEIKGK
jgi:thioredoxin-dependent peroxiredoxin